MVRKAFYVFVIFSMFLIYGCSGEKRVWIDNLSAAEEKEFESGTIPEERIENLKKGVSFYEKEVERTVRASKQIGIYYRMLALEYMSLEMYAEAFKNIEKAVEFFPTSPKLYYYGGVSAAQMSISVFNEQKIAEYLDAAEKHYLRALKLDPYYTEALYAISVLYIFELNRPFDAEKFLELLVQRSRTNYDAMFMLARVKILRGEVDEAIELYSIVEEKASEEETRQRAKENRMKLLGGYAND
jgi:tetratricopeptide (TPR) repeat protein